MLAGNSLACGYPSPSPDLIPTEMTQRINPGSGRESAWDYPRPPALEPCTRHIQIIINGEILADTNRSDRVLETSHPLVITYLLMASA